MDYCTHNCGNQISYEHKGETHQPKKNVVYLGHILLCSCSCCCHPAMKVHTICHHLHSSLLAATIKQAKVIFQVFLILAILALFVSKTVDPQTSVNFMMWMVFFCWMMITVLSIFIILKYGVSSAIDESGLFALHLMGIDTLSETRSSVNDLYTNV